MDKKITTEQLIKAGLENRTAKNIVERVNKFLTLPALEAWENIQELILTPAFPFLLHKLLYKIVFSDYNLKSGPAPAWIPNKEYIKNTNIGLLMSELKINTYKEFHDWSCNNRTHFWKLIVKKLGIVFKKEYKELIDLSGGIESSLWFKGGSLNISDSCLDNSEKTPAIIYQQEDGSLKTMSHAELISLSNRVANGITNAGLKPGDAIAIDMPMTVESVAIYLAIIKAGCVVISIADSFAPEEIKKRLELGGAKAIFTQEYIIRAGKKLPLYEKVLKADAPKAIVLNSKHIKLRVKDCKWADFLSEDNTFTSVSCSPSSFINILFSSGTTGEPKAIPWTHSTPVKCAMDGYMHHNIRKGDIVAWPSNLGWMMGPWLIFAGLINRATIALYVGSPTSREFCRFVQDTRVTMLGVVPSLVRAWRNNESIKRLDWSCIKAFSSTGECSNSEDMLFLMSRAGYKPVIEYCGGTEIGGGHITGTVVLPSAPGTFSTPALGLDFVVLDEDGSKTDNGEIFLIPPSIGLSVELLNKDHHKIYFEGTPHHPDKSYIQLSFGGKKYPLKLRRHGDQVEKLGGGYFRMHGRIDDTMNLGGIKVSSIEIEQLINTLDGIRETAAIAVPSPGGGLKRLVIYAVLLVHKRLEKNELKATFQAMIKQHLNPLFKIYDTIIIKFLPRTASNKIMRRILKNKYINEGH